MTNSNRRQFLRSGAIALAAAQLSRTSAAAASFSEGSLPSLNGATGWLNSQPLTSAGLRGKVVLIDFWTYTCINWRRTFPSLRAWDQKYRKHGLVVLGVHTPEFAFEHELDNVSQAVREMNLEYPVAIDNDYAVWRAFDNEYWPALYLADAQGHIQYHAFGEGDYDKSEAAIQRLLRKAGATDIDAAPTSIGATGAELTADWADLRSGENYVGYERTENFASHGGFDSGKPHNYTSPERLRLNEWALTGNWTAQKQAIVLNEANGRIAYQFHARDLHLVMGPAVRGSSVRFRVRIDGLPPAAAHGIDVDEQGNGTLTLSRMYQLIRQPKPIVDRRFDIEFLDVGATVFSFTFG